MQANLTFGRHKVSVSKNLVTAFCLCRAALLLLWHHQKECENMVILLCCFHVNTSFSKVIGQYQADSGTKDVLEESGVFGEKKKKQTAVNIMKGKQWNCVARAQKLAFEAHFRILLLNYNLSAMDGR